MCHQSASSGSDETLQDEINRKMDLIRQRHLDRPSSSGDERPTHPRNDLGSASEVFAALRDNSPWIQRGPNDDGFTPSDYQTLKTNPTN